MPALAELKLTPTKNWLPRGNESSKIAETEMGSDIRALIIEQKDALVEERVGVACLLVNRKGKLVNSETGVTIGKRRKTNFDTLENIATNVIGKRALRNESGISIWVSSLGGIYKETRINIYETLTGQGLQEHMGLIQDISLDTATIKRIKKAKKAILLYSIPTTHDGQQCLDIARGLTINSQKLTSLDMLRATPVWLATNSSYWVDVLSEFIILPQGVWQKIKNKEVFRAKKEALLVGQKLVEKYYPRIIAAGNDSTQHRLIQWSIEQDAKRMGYAITSGPCWLVGAFDEMYSLAQNRVPFGPNIASQEEFDYPFEKGDCVGCASKGVDVGPCKLCKNCDRKIRRSSSYN